MIVRPDTISACILLAVTAFTPVVAQETTPETSSLGTVEPSFPKVNLIGRDPALVDSWVKRGCPDTKTETNKCEGRLTLVSYGGEDGYGDAVLRAAERLDREGIPVAFIRASDNNDDPTNATVSAYAQGEWQEGLESSSDYTFFDQDFIQRNNTEQTVYDMGKRVYRVEIATR